MSQSLRELEAAFASATNVAEQREVLELTRQSHARTQSRLRGALKGVWLGIALMVTAVVLAAFFGGDYRVPLIIVPAVLFVVLVPTAVGLALAKGVRGQRYSRVIAVQESTILAAQQRG